ncbi:MAG: hypothetical protein M3133_05645 [Actinomycetota bacterium]|nr:hypothetical protein [Actinomycetota bacterium]
MRVLVVSDDASLAVALSLMGEDREVVFVRAASEVASDDVGRFDTTVIDVGTTNAGLEVVAQLAKAGVAAPCLLLGDVEAPPPHPDVHVVVRPFSLERLDERLRLRPWLEGMPQDGRFGRRLLGRFRRMSQGPAPIRGHDVSSEDRPYEGTSSPEDAYEESAPAVRHAVAGWGENDDVEQRGAVGEPRQAAPGPASPRVEPRSYPRFRSATKGTHATPSTSLGRLLSLAEELERLAADRPELLDPRAVARRILDEAERELRPEAATLWLPREDSTYEAYETSGLGVAEGIRVPQGQALFQSFNADVDSVLIEPLDVSQRPVSGIPGLVGESLVAAALRLTRTLVGVVIATGRGFTATQRERLDSLVSRAAPDLAIAGLIERLADVRRTAAGSRYV